MSYVEMLKLTHTKEEIMHFVISSRNPVFRRKYGTKYKNQYLSEDNSFWNKKLTMAIGKAENSKEVSQNFEELPDNKSSTMKTTRRTKIPPMPTIGQLLRIFKVSAKKQLAQNFLLDPSINDKLVRAAGPDLSGHHVCEVGPGPGGITRSIITHGAETLTVIEKDRRFMPSLEFLVQNVGEDKLKIILNDILRYDMLHAFPKSFGTEWEADIPKLRVIGNLPFNVSLPLLFQLLTAISSKSSLFELGRVPLLLVFQQEIGERLTAKPYSLQRSRLSVTSQVLCDVKYKFMIKGSSFTPAPKVDAAVISFVPRKKFLIDLPFKTIDQVTKHVFHFRQKYCISGIKSLFPPKRLDLSEEMIKMSGIDPKMRPTELSNEHYRDLCFAYDEITQRIPQLSTIDTYSPKVWRKYFNEDGEPLT